MNNNNYYIINFGNENHDIKILNLNSLDYEIIMSVSKNLIDDRNEIEYSTLTKSLFEDISLLNLGKYYFEKLSNDKEIDSENKFFYYNSILKKNRFIQANTLLDYFNEVNINNRYNNIKSIYKYSSNIQKIFSPSYELLDNNYYNTNFIISACNDQTIRYWDISKSSLKEKKSYIINAPNDLVNCYYSQSYFNKSLFLIQSNEYYGVSFNNIPEYNYYGEYQFFNNANITDLKNGKLNYGKRIVEASHQNIITDIQYMELNQSLDNENDFPFILLTSSWDGTIKIWK
jgi:WD40 repeat protein